MFNFVHNKEEEDVLCLSMTVRLCHACTLSAFYFRLFLFWLFEISWMFKKRNKARFSPVSVLYLSFFSLGGDANLGRYCTLHDVSSERRSLCPMTRGPSWRLTPPPHPWASSQPCIKESGITVKMACACRILWGYLCFPARPLKTTCLMAIDC